MPTTILRGVLLVAFVLTFAHSAVAQSLVRGTVVDEEGKPVEGALVQFAAIDFLNEREVKTDRRGQFLFQGLDSGNYEIDVTKEGYGKTGQTVSVTRTNKVDLKFVLPAPRVATTVPDGPPALEVLAAVPAPTEDSKQAKQDKEALALRALASSAMDAYRGERHEESVTQLSELVTKLPTCGDCYLYLGNSYVALKKPEEAEAAFLKSVEVNPTVEGYTALTRLYNEQRKYDRATEVSQKAADLAAAVAPAPGAPGAAEQPSGNSDAFYNQGVVLWNAGKFAEAKARFEAAVAANPKNASALYQLGIANLNLSQFPQARTAFEAYLKVAPDDPKAAEVKALLGQLPK